MIFNKRFRMGLMLLIGGILGALNFIGDYRLLSAASFWGAMLAAGTGIFLMFQGIEERKTPPPEE